MICTYDLTATTKKKTKRNLKVIQMWMIAENAVQNALQLIAQLVASSVLTDREAPQRSRDIDFHLVKLFMMIEIDLQQERFR